MKTFAMVTFLALGIGVPGADGQETVGRDRLYGRVVTAGGDVYEGFLRWDRNEGSWSDLLNGTKEVPWENLHEARRLDEDYDGHRRDRSIRILGLRISWSNDGDDYPSTTSSGVRFGHLRSLATLGHDRALLILKSGEEIELEGGSTDLGDELRDLVVDDPERGAIELRWRDLDIVEFMQAPRGFEPSSGERLYGTMKTREGLEFTGYVAWDADEILTSDILDGEERGRDREIRFSLIAGIERESSSGARVVLKNGEEILLRDSNDVDDGNRGIAISDPALGQVEVDWDDFDALTFHAAPPNAAGYEDFDGGHPLYGTVVTVEGERYTGQVRWDNDEASSWEMLNGRDGDVEFDVEFGQIASIRRAGSWGSYVTLSDGRAFELGDSNDVDGDNKGIFVTLDDGEVRFVRWRNFREVVFDTP